MKGHRDLHKHTEIVLRCQASRPKVRKKFERQNRTPIKSARVKTHCFMLLLKLPYSRSGGKILEINLATGFSAKKSSFILQEPRHGLSMLFSIKLFKNGKL